MTLRLRILIFSSLLLLSQTLLAWHLPAHLQEQLAEDGAAFGITLSGDECSLSGHGATLPVLAPPPALPPFFTYSLVPTLPAPLTATAIVPPARGPPSRA